MEAKLSSFVRAPLDKASFFLCAESVEGAANDEVTPTDAVRADMEVVFVGTDIVVTTCPKYVSCRVDNGTLAGVVWPIKFMSTREIGDKQQYAIMIDELERNMALGVWLFSLPSLNYFSTQFDSTSINLYGVSSQFSTIEKWREKSKK